jgi:hypothetical protein
MMSGDLYLKNNAGRISEQAAVQTSSGVANAGNIAALDSSGHFDITLLPTSVGAETISLPASENLTAGNLVNIWSNAEVTSLRKADATTAGKEADGYVTANVTSGQNGTIYLEGVNAALTGLTIGIIYFLDTIAGGVTSTAPSASGNVNQTVGKATATGSLIFRYLGRGIVKA